MTLADSPTTNPTPGETAPPIKSYDYCAYVATMDTEALNACISGIDNPEFQALLDAMDDDNWQDFQSFIDAVQDRYHAGDELCQWRHPKVVTPEQALAFEKAARAAKNEDEEALAARHLVRRTSIAPFALNFGSSE